MTEDNKIEKMPEDPQEKGAPKQEAREEPPPLSEGKGLPEMPAIPEDVFFGLQERFPWLTEVPGGFTCIDVVNYYEIVGAAFIHGDRDLKVMASISVREDGKTWLHVSMSRKKRVPSYKDMQKIKAVFVGLDNYAYEVFPPAKFHVNIHKYCRHFWSPVGHCPLPEFSTEFEGIRAV